MRVMCKELKIAPTIKQGLDFLAILAYNYYQLTIAHRAYMNIINTILFIKDNKKDMEKIQIGMQITRPIDEKFTEYCKERKVSKVLYIEALMFAEMEANGVEMQKTVLSATDERKDRRAVITRLQLSGKAAIARDVIAGKVNWKDYKNILYTSVPGFSAVQRIEEDDEILM